MEAVLAIEPGWYIEAFFDALAAMSETAHLVQMFDSTVVRVHVSAAGAKRMARPVVKWLDSSGLDNLRKRIRPFGNAVGQDGDPRVLVLIRGPASMRHFAP